MPIPQTLRGWTHVTGAGTSLEEVSGSGTQTAIPFERPQAPTVAGSGDPSGVMSRFGQVFNRLVDRLESATRGSRSIPYGAGGTVLESVSFTAGVAQTIAHRLGTPAVNVLGWCRSGSSGYGFFAVSSDGGSVILTPNATFTADVHIVVCIGVPTVYGAAAGPSGCALPVPTIDTSGGTVSPAANVATWHISNSSTQVTYDLPADTAPTTRVIGWYAGLAPIVAPPTGWSLINPLTGVAMAANATYTYSANPGESYNWLSVSGLGSGVVWPSPA